MRRNGGREASNDQMPIEKDRGNLGALEQIAKIAVGLVELVDLLGEPEVDGVQLFIERLQLFLRGLQLLVGRLHFLVDRVQLFVGAAQFLERGLMLLAERLQLLAIRRKRGLQVATSFRARRHRSQQMLATGQSARLRRPIAVAADSLQCCRGPR